METECNACSFDFQPLGSREVTVRFDGGRISSDGGGVLLRELRAAGARLAELDRDKDGVIAGTEVPQRMTCEIIRGATTRDMQNGISLPPIVLRAGGEAALPAWMIAMDQNGDGELSSNEFLGPPQEFQRLDQNADGFLDSKETQ